MIKSYFYFDKISKNFIGTTTKDSTNLDNEYIYIDTTIDQLEKYNSGITYSLDENTLLITENLEPKKLALINEIYEFSIKYGKIKYIKNNKEYIIETSILNNYLKDNIDLAYAAKENTTKYTFSFFDPLTKDLLIEFSSDYSISTTIDSVYAINNILYLIDKDLLYKNKLVYASLASRLNYSNLEFSEILEIKNTYKDQFIQFLELSDSTILQ